MRASYNEYAGAAPKCQFDLAALIGRRAMGLLGVVPSRPSAFDGQRESKGL